MPRIVVARGTAPDRARELAERLGLPLVDDPAGAAADLVLLVGDRLALRLAGPGAPGAVAVEFGDAAAVRRSRGPGGEMPLLARAVGLDRGVRTVIDATAGLGRDAGTLAAAGARVTMVERDPVLAAMLDDGLGRARQDGMAAVERLELVHADAGELLAGLPPDAVPDAVLIDPMFVDRGKSALPGKDLQVLRALHAEDPGDVAETLRIARAVARRRVVVKRPARGRPPAPDVAATYRGARICYDVYAPRA